MASRPKQTSASKKLTPAEQSARFIEAAKKTGADESGKEFARVINTIVPPKNVRRKQP